MQEINFGRIEGLVIRNGEPVFEPAPRVIRYHKLGGENGPRRERELDDFVLKAKVTELFEQFEAIGNGKIVRIEIKYGIPFLMEVEERNLA